MLREKVLKSCCEEVFSLSCCVEAELQYRDLNTYSLQSDTLPSPAPLLLSMAQPRPINNNKRTEDFSFLPLCSIHHGDHTLTQHYLGKSSMVSVSREHKKDIYVKKIIQCVTIAKFSDFNYFSSEYFIFAANISIKGFVSLSS